MLESTIYLSDRTFHVFHETISVIVFKGFAARCAVYIFISTVFNKIIESM